MSDQEENQKQAAEPPEHEEYRVQIIDDRTREVANALREIADSMESGHIHAVALAMWGLSARKSEREEGETPHSQNLMWENPDPNIVGCFVPLIGSICMLRTRMEHALINEQAHREMPSPEMIATMLMTPTDNPQ